MTALGYLVVSCLPLLPFVLVARKLRWGDLRAFVVLWALAVPLDWAQINLLGFYTPTVELARPSFISIPLVEWVFILTVPLRVWVYCTIGRLVWLKRRS